jgi:hypothetical protein
MPSTDPDVAHCAGGVPAPGNSPDRAVLADSRTHIPIRCP